MSDVRVIRTYPDKAANAAFAGVWPGPRYVFVTDYLLDSFSADEIDAVLTHEIAHGTQHHVLC
ncbi:MAG: M48 family metalloprotease [Streptosporangiaceae bacterium]